MTRWNSLKERKEKKDKATMPGIMKQRILHTCIYTCRLRRIIES